ncbi:MAG: DUF4388 domain-containing protein [Actinomycetota bacterium]
MLKGTLDDFILPDVFRLASHAGKTGRLEVERRNGSGRVYFRDGDVYFAESTKSKEPLGRKLVRSGWITEKQLERAIEAHEETGERLGEILVNHGIVEESQVEWAVRSQIEDAVFDLLRWDLGAFVWEPDVEIEAEIPLTVTVENLIIEASRRLDEISQIRRKIPSPEVVLVMAPRPPDGAHQINITAEEWQVLVLVNGHRTVADIATFTGVEAYQTTRLLFGLMNAGLIEITKGTPEAPEETRRGRHSHTERWDEDDDPVSNVVELQPEKNLEPETASAPPAPPAPHAGPQAESPVDEEIDEQQPAPERPAAQSQAGEGETEERGPLPPPAPVRSSGRSSGPRVDRSAVVRELAGLFSDGLRNRPKAVPSGGAGEKTDSAPPQKRRVEDDDQVDRKLIGRMIDGVKGL